MKLIDRPSLRRSIARPGVRRLAFLALGLAVVLTTAVAGQAYEAAESGPPPSMEDLRPLGPMPGAGTPTAANARPDVLSPEAHRRFADQVDLDAFRKLAVFDNGRAKIFDTLAIEKVERIYGRTKWRDPETGRRYDPAFTYLDILFNKPYYFDKPMIYVEVLPLRRELVTALRTEVQEEWLRRGRLAPQMFGHPHFQSVLEGASADLRLQRGRNQTLSALFTFGEQKEALEMVSPRPGEYDWIALESIGVHRQASAGGAMSVRPVADISAVADAQLAGRIVEAARALRLAWPQGDVDTVNTNLNLLAELIPQLNPDTYPAGWLREIEHLYNATRKFTVGYLAYFVAAVMLLIAFGVYRRWLIVSGVSFLVLGFGVHTAGIVIRAILAGRLPIHNQFEAFIWVAWLSVAVGLIAMLISRQWLFGAAASALGTVCLMVANTVSIPSNELGQVAGILGTSSILYIHVNVVLFSYGLIALGFFVSLFYLGSYYLGSSTPAMRAEGRRLEEGGGAATADGGPDPVAQFAAAGLGLTPDETRKLPGPVRILHDLDRSQMVILQLAFWILGVGILLGAYWADHAWGRWWAWDPKETWSLITWIVYLIVIHVRFGVKNRGLVTAWLSVVGFFVMLWCFWGVNLLLAGLHSYA